MIWPASAAATRTVWALACVVQRLALECIAAALVLGLLALNGCLPTGLILPGAGYVECALAPLLWAVLLVAMAEAARVADGPTARCAARPLRSCWA